MILCVPFAVVEINRVVVDANIVFSALMKDSLTRRLILTTPTELYAPEMLMQEVKKYKEKILKFSKLPEHAYELLLALIEESIIIIPKQQYAYNMDKVQSPDPDDAEYLALAMTLNCPLWSNDNALTQQKAITILSTQEIKHRL